MATSMLLYGHDSSALLCMVLEFPGHTIIPALILKPKAQEISVP